MGELCLIAYFFLLRVGKYTTNDTRQTSQMQQFRLQDVAFFHQHHPLSFSTLQANPSLPDLVRLCIDNQKMAAEVKSLPTMPSMMTAAQ